MNNTEKLAMCTPSLADENFAALAALFPNAVTETIDENGSAVRAIDKDVLTQEINAHVVEGREERYQFTWPDKRKSILLANAPIAASLRPCNEESVDFDTTENLYIEGDNLDVLKLLRETYLNRIDVIYIDPPYNTGNSLIYHNDFFQNVDSYVSNSGQYDDEGNRLVPNTESNGRYHTDWLNMIYPRLRIAKDLLKETGILVLTIDDYEINTVTTVLNEIFGEDNHLGTVVIKNNPSGRSTVKGFSINHEYALFYARTKSASLGMMKHNDNQIARYKEKDDNGFFEWENFRKNGTDSDRNDRPKQFYPIIINEATEKLRIPRMSWSDKEKEYEILEPLGQQERMLMPITPVGTEKVWKYGVERASLIIGEILVKRVSEGYELYRKKYLNESGSLPRTWWDKPEYSARDNGTRVLTNIFGPQKLFDFPKAPEAVKDALTAANLQDDGIVLDFFSGSATTAHAVMQLNAEDGGKRKFVMVQLPEVCAKGTEAEKAGYKTICEIGKERIRRVGAKIKTDSPLTTGNLDVGFRVLKLDSSNMKDVYYTPDEYSQMNISFEGLVDNIKEGRSPDDLLFQVMLDLGIPLSARIMKDNDVFSVNNNYLIACFKQVDTDLITEIAKKKPYYAVFRDGSFINDSAMVNFGQVFATYSPNTIRRVL